MARLSVDKALLKAKSHAKKGESEEAQKLYQAVLQAFPKNRRAQQGLVSLNKFKQPAITQGPPQETINQLIKAYNQGQLAAVVEQAQFLTEQYPDAFFVWNILGAAHMGLGKTVQASAAFKKVIELDPKYEDGFSNLGIALKEQGKLEEAIASFNKALSLNPDAFFVWNHLGVAYNGLAKFVEASAAFKKVTELNPKYADGFSNLGIILQKQGKLEEAIASFNKALSLNPDYAEAYNNMGDALAERGKLKEAIEFFKKALSFKPDYAQAYYNMGNTFKDQGKLEEALAALKKAISLKSDFDEAYKSMGRLHWLHQNFNKAFELMEWRWNRKNSFNIGAQLISGKPQWNGEHNTQVFVWKEQGIGDEIMFGSTLKELSSISSQIIVECDKRLMPLYKRSFSKKIKFVKDRNNLMENEYRTQIAIGALLKHFRHNLDDFENASAGWLKAESRKSAAFRKRLQKQKNDKIIGISWFTKSRKATSHRRNVPMKLLANCLQQVPAQYVNLQYGVAVEEFVPFSSKQGLKLNHIEELDLFNDLDGLAALISACDIVISIDNATVHLAGALGIDTRVLLPLTADERWGLNSVDSYWYDSVTLYRQKTLADWTDPLQSLMIDLKKIHF